MKTKSLAIIFILFLIITLASAMAVLFTKDQVQPIAVQDQNIVQANSNVQPEQEKTKSKLAPASPEPINQIKTSAPEIKINQPTEQISVSVLIDGVKYETKIKATSSVYDLMQALKNQKKIDFQGKNYADLGFFVEEINGVKNNPAGENWLYYVNGQPGQVGISYYLLKPGDAIEWKYEKRSF